MTDHLSQPGEVVDLNRSATAGDTNQIVSLVHGDAFHLLRLQIPAGETIPTYEAPGQIILHCLEGRISLQAQGASKELASDQLVHLIVNEPFSIRAIERSTVLATIGALKEGGNVALLGG